MSQSCALMSPANTSNDGKDLQMRSAVRRRKKTARVTRAERPRGSATEKTLDLPFDKSVGYQIRMTNRAFQMRLRERVEPFGVSQGMWYFLRLLWQEDGLTQGELGRSIGLMEPTAFTALSRMERRGLVTRVAHPTDRRKVNVFLTAHGNALRHQMLPLAHDINAEGLRGLTKTEIVSLLRVLKRIERNLLTSFRRQGDQR